MARTFRNYYNAEGERVKDHRDGKTGWVVSPRKAERAAKRSQRQAVKQKARKNPEEI